MYTKAFLAHVGHFALMQDNFTDNITFFELSELVRVVSLLVISYYVLFLVMVVVEKCQYLWF